MSSVKTLRRTKAFPDVERGEAASSRGRPRSQSLDRRSERRNSFGRNREIMKLGERDHSAASLFDEKYGKKRDRAEQRRKMMAYLLKDSSKTAPSPQKWPFFVRNREPEQEPDYVEEEGVRLLELADTYQSSRAFHFNRFERLCILDVLHSQHSLIKLDEEIQYNRKGDVSDETANRLHLRIQIYSQKLSLYSAYCTANVPFYRGSYRSFPKAFHFKADGLPN